MKSFILLVTSFIFLLAAGARPLDHSTMNMLEPQQQQEVMLYLQQAKTAKVAGWSFCITGTVLAVLGSFMVIESEKEYTNSNNHGNMEDAGTALVFVGAATAGFSIRLFRKAHSNHERVGYILSKNRKAFIAPRFSPASQTAGIKLMIPF